MTAPFRIGISSGFRPNTGTSLLSTQALALFETHGLDYAFFHVEGGEVQAENIAGYDAVLLLGERFGARALEGNPRLMAVGRWGVGYDAVDLDACTVHDVCVFITRKGVRRPVALAALTFLLALTLKLRARDRLVREGGWDRKTEHMGEMLTGKVLGSLGFGGIAREMYALAAPLGMRHIAHDPYCDAAEARRLGVELVDKLTLLRQADVLCIHCLLNAETRHSIGAAELALMKPSAYLINTARGPIVDEAALIDALQGGRLRGAGLDVFEQEPLPLDSPLLALDNVWLAPHALAWTEELVLNLSMEDAEGLARLARGELPDAVVNTAVLERPGFYHKLQARVPRND